MKALNPRKLTTEFTEGVSQVAPLIPRRYTLTHSDDTGELNLQIGLEFAFDKISDNRDEVLGEWIWNPDGICYYVYLQISKGNTEKENQNETIRETIFRRELPLALQAIRYGDGLFFKKYPEFNKFPILVIFFYHKKDFNKVENWGNFSKYNIL